MADIIAHMLRKPVAFTPCVCASSWRKMASSVSAS